jgi:uncharacterized protein YdaU (DUF1376 family)
MTAWFAFFGRDFLASTLGWSAEERGHYLTLLVAQWENDGLPNDLKRLELISPGVGKCWKLIEVKFPIGKGGRRRNVRLEHERHLAYERSERARQSASARWSEKATAQTAKADIPAASEGSECSEQCSEQCERIPPGICSGDASMTMSYSPPPPPPPPGLETVGEQEGWQRLKDAWNAAWGEKRQWRSNEPPEEAIARLREPGWLDEAIGAIPAIKGGACSGFKTPPTLRQFCARDPARGSFVARMLGGEFTDGERTTRIRKEVPA